MAERSGRWLNPASAGDQVIVLVKDTRRIMKHIIKGETIAVIAGIMFAASAALAQRLAAVRRRHQEYA